jgi:hypothetical protein
MTHRTSPTLALGLGVSLLLGACQAQAPQVPPRDARLDLQTLHASASCGSEQASLRPVADAAALARIVNAADTLGTPPKAIAVDFTQRAVFQLSMGQQPNTGSGLAVHSGSVDASRLTVNVQWQLPEPGRMYAMRATQPCVVFSLPRGDYRSARVLDQHGQQKLAVELMK